MSADCLPFSAVSLHFQLFVYLLSADCLHFQLFVYNFSCLFTFVSWLSALSNFNKLKKYMEKNPRNFSLPMMKRNNFGFCRNFVLFTFCQLFVYNLNFPSQCWKMRLFGGIFKHCVVIWKLTEKRNHACNFAVTILPPFFHIFQRPELPICYFKNHLAKNSKLEYLHIF